MTIDVTTAKIVNQKFCKMFISYIYLKKTLGAVVQPFLGGGLLDVMLNGVKK